ncbi:tRNA(Ile)-lysidine synthase [Mycoplasmopsis californica]|uniref:tRNA(Ile)-lysidine synthase n=1 Tax=Mycoplasmopsis equigenitalium TaxID=114883 RepID=A0ABY5J4S8_9BACT|nr:tRNA lysidine(34) synthetase TilS [Mycoplasmopsis equigenitalium]UUD36891.1 tRNA lysidine(34) synthetase TilS [Mycoplasmopsis equigenitalium]VEU69814.1 tRNA(Ile)-lysidine synthase [Mycoplasmopsis californica]
MSKILIAVSGGPDSMYLLNLYKNENIIACHINYNKRESALRDEGIVVNFCNQNNIKLYKKVLPKDFNFMNNFQDCARRIRYDFFKEVYALEKCDVLLIAHHLDDFVETCLMQEDKGVNPLYFGIKEETKLQGMNIKRPLLFKIRKKQIIDFLDLNKIPYGIDETNFLDIYERNKIRNKLKNINDNEFNKILEKFLKINKKCSEKNKEINTELEEWKKEKWSSDAFKKLVYKKEVLFAFIHANFNEVNITSKKLDEIIKFIESTVPTSSYKLKDDIFLKKKKHFIII